MHHPLHLRTVASTVLTTLILLPGCAPGPEDAAGPDAPSAPADAVSTGDPEDPHSHARPDEVAVTHLTLDLDVDFETRRLTGTASLELDNRTGAEELVLDTADLDVRRVSLDDGAETDYTLGEEDPDLPSEGRPLTVAITPDTRTVHVDYATSPDAGALQWLDPAQTSGDHPFLFTQSQAILARSWIPLQDTPAVRFTYDATVRVPPGLMAVMSAENPRAPSNDGVYTFSMPQPVPSYLMALAVGELELRTLGERSGVYAEPAVADAAAHEFAETPAMIDAAEALYGPYRWGRYDLLVLPPSFPFGGMENPRLTFLTPTIIAGDRSLVTLVAHELAHSWSGNLVTNANWNDFWLNEGFTVYLERRIMEELHGREYAEMLAALGRQDLEETIDDLGPRSDDTHLHLDLAGRDPDDGMTDVAYEKGALFLRRLEERVGRERWDAFLHDYFDRFAFRSMDTAGFLRFLDRELLEPEGLEPEELRIDAWVHGPGLPANAPEIESDAFDRVEAEIERWRGDVAASALETGGWSTHEWLHFLRNLPDELTAERMKELDREYALTETGNSEILCAWLLVAIRSDYSPADEALERFLTTQGRRKFLEPLYEELAKTERGLARAREIYAEGRPTYHPVSRKTIDDVLEWEA